MKKKKKIYVYPKLDALRKQQNMIRVFKQQSRQQKELYQELIEEYLTADRRYQITRINLSFFEDSTEFLKRQLLEIAGDAKEDLMNQFRSFCKSREKTQAGKIEELRNIHYHYNGKNHKIYIPSIML